VKNFFLVLAYNLQVLYNSVPMFNPCIKRTRMCKHWLFDWVQVDC